MEAFAFVGAAAHASTQATRSDSDEVPKEGDTILVLDRKCLQQVLGLSKTMLIRKKSMEAKCYWLGCDDVIYGRARTRPGVRITSQLQWSELRPQHQDPRETSYYDRKAPPHQWTKTIGIALEDVRCVQYVDYVGRPPSRPGCRGRTPPLVAYHPPASTAEAVFAQAAGTPDGQRRSPKKRKQHC